MQASTVESCNTFVALRFFIIKRKPLIVLFGWFNLGASSTMEMTSYNSTDNFFLRPFLTREEYAYWNSHFRRVSSSYSYPKDNTTVTCDESWTSCVSNATGVPCCDGRRPPGGPAVHGNGFSENCCSNSRKDEMPCFPEFIPSTTSHKIMNARKCQCPYCTNKRIKEKVNQNDEFVENPSFHDHFVPGSNCKMCQCPSCTNKGINEMANQYNEVDKNPTSIQHFVPRTRQTGDHLNRSNYCCDTREGRGAHQESTPANLREKMYGKHLCGDITFGENPSLVLTSGHEGVNPNNGSGVPFDSISAHSMHSGLGSRECCSVKRKSTSPLENDRYAQRKCKKRFIGHDVNGIHDLKAPREIKDAYKNLKLYQSQPSPISSCCIKDTRYQISESHDIRKSRELTTPPLQDCTEKKTSAITSGTGCLTETETIIIDLSHESSDTALKKCDPQVDDQTPNGRNKPLERKDIGEVLKTTKPVQRKLMTSDKTSVSNGCAFDHDSLPKLIGVLPSAMATMMSNLAK